MHLFAKAFLLLATLITLGLIATYFAYAWIGHSENTSLALHWLSIGAVVLWVPLTGISILVMAVTSKNSGPLHRGKRSILEWIIAVSLLLLSLYLINSSYSSVWQGLTNGWFSNPTLPMLTFGAGLVSLVASFALFARHKWSLHTLLLAFIVLLAMSNYETFRMYRAMPFVSFLFSVATKNFVAMVVLASFIYLRKRREIA
jgi:hypothetical protein